MAWRLETKSARLDHNVISAIVDLISSSDNQLLRFKDIHSGLVEKKLTTMSNQRKTALYLRRLCERGTLVKTQTGAYALKTSAKDFETFAYLDWLKERYAKRGMTQPFWVGGMMWKESHGMVVPFVGTPNKLDEFLLGQLETLLSSTFYAVKDMRDRILLLEAGFDTGYSQQTMRQSLIAIVWNIIGREDIGNAEVYEILRRLTKTGRKESDEYRQISEQGLAKLLTTAMEMWKRTLYDVHGESSDEDGGEDIWRSMLRQNGESWDQVEALVKRDKEDLKNSGIDIDHVSLSELRSRKQALDDSIQAKMPPPDAESFGMASYSLTSEESELSGNLDKAIGIKRVEAFLSKGIDWEDFAIVLTTPPEVMSRYNTILHELKDEVGFWKKEVPIDDELLLYFASKLLTHDLSTLRVVGVGPMVGLTDDQVDKIVGNWQDLRKQWKKEGERPEVTLTKKKEAIIFAKLGSLAAESSH